MTYYGWACVFAVAGAGCIGLDLEWGMLGCFFMSIGMFVAGVYGDA